MRITSWALLLALALAPGLRAEPGPDAAVLTALLRDFLAGASRQDVAMHDRFWAEDLVYTSAAGRRKGKADILRELRSPSPATAATPSDTPTTYTAEDVRIRQYGDTAVVAFRLVATPRPGPATAGAPAGVTSYLNTGTFLKRRGKWQAVAWQATRAGEEGGK